MAGKLAALTTVLLMAHGASAQAVAADTVRLASGVRYVVHLRGEGALPQSDQSVLVHYTGFLPNGRMFESSAADGRPVRVHLGKHEVIPGWEEVLPLLPVGTRAWVYIPAQQAYGSQGTRQPDDEQRYLIPPNTDLRFELQILKAK